MIRELHQVLHVPQMAKNLLSVRHLCKEWKLNILFDEASCELISMGSHEPVAVGVLEMNLYKLDCQTHLDGVAEANDAHSAMLAKTLDADSEQLLWHCKLGHPNYVKMKKMPKQDLYREKLGWKVDETDVICAACIHAKLPKRNPKKRIDQNRAEGLLDMVHTDLCGPMSTKSIGGTSYFTVVVDDYSRFTMMYFLQNKSKALEKFVQYVQYSQRQNREKAKGVEER